MSALRDRFLLVVSRWPSTPGAASRVPARKSFADRSWSCCLAAAALPLKHQLASGRAFLFIFIPLILFAGTRAGTDSSSSRVFANLPPWSFFQHASLGARHFCQFFGGSQPIIFFISPGRVALLPGCQPSNHLNVATTPPSLRPAPNLPPPPALGLHSRTPLLPTHPLTKFNRRVPPLAPRGA